jgi:3-deoxy-manno-octulosonate cytidylyltransferase (CMP-KDO synthetase)
MGSSLIAIIPARFESTRLPGKPLALIHGKPMIQHVYERTAEARGVERVIVATDDERVRAVVRGFGGEAVMTDAGHVSGTDRIAEVAAGLAADIVVNVQGDLPHLDPAMVTTAAAPLQADSGLPMATLCTPITDDGEWRNPNVVKVVVNADGMALYFSRSPLPHHRDEVPAGSVLGQRHIGLYVYRRDFLLTFAGLQPTPLERAERLEQLRALERGYRIRVVEVEKAAIEVDTPQDLERARAVAGLGG